MPTSLERAVEIMDRLRSPGGCPWDAEQTHESLTRYLLEEAYEVIEAVETQDPVLLREELGDLLLQVLFHARIAEEATTDAAFGIEDVARDLGDKLIRRHPHVFGDRVHGEARAVDAEALNEAWERQKIAEKGRTSVVDGVPIDQPALALAAKLVARGRRAGLLDIAAPNDISDATSAESDADNSAGPDTKIGAQLLATVHEAVRLGVDPEGALRRAARGLRDELVAAEQSDQNGL